MRTMLFIQSTGEHYSQVCAAARSSQDLGLSHVYWILARHQWHSCELWPDALLCLPIMLQPLSSLWRTGSVNLRREMC